ncbi:MAG: MFS transporter [Promethearchaeota archaeon]
MVNIKTSTLLITGSAHGLVHLLMLALPYITAKLLEVTAVPPGQEGLVVLLLNTPSYFIFGLGAIPAGILTDRFAPTRVITLGLSLTVASGIALFFLWPLGIGAIALLFILYSFGAGLYHPAGTTWVSNVFPENRGKALGRHGIGGSIGQAASPIISATILSTPAWPLIFPFLATAGLIVSFICVRFHTERLHPEDEAPSASASKSGLFSAMSVVVFGLMSVTLISRGMFYRASVTALPIYLNRELQALLILAGLLGTLIYVGGAIGQEVGGRLTDRVGWQIVLIYSCILSSISLLLLSLPYSPNVLNDMRLISAIMLFGFSYFAAQAASNTMVALLATPQNRGTVFGYSFFARFGLGAFGIIIVSSYQLIYGTWVTGFLALAFLTLLAAACIPFIKPRDKSK